MFAARNHLLTPASAGVPLGLSPALATISGESAAWGQHLIDISAYKNRTIYVVFLYISGTSFTGDIQLDDIYIDGTTYDFESTASGFTTSTSGELSYTSVVFTSIPSTSSSALRWNRDLGGTSSASTGLSVDHTLGTNLGYYLYAETSSPGYSDKYFWLRSPQRTLSNSPYNLSFWAARYGATIGTLYVHIDVIS